jgi:hypothetical protein
MSHHPNIAWESSVERARVANLQAIAGRLAVATASFEQIGMFGEGTSNSGGRTLLSFAEEVGVEYEVLTKYRAVTYWWYESDPVALINKIPAPVNMSWSAMLAGKRYFPVANDFRELLSHHEPSNGRVFTKPDILRIRFGRENPVEESTAPPRRSPYEMAMFSLPRMGSRIRTLRHDLATMDLTGEERDALDEAVERAMEEMDNLREVIAPKVVA